MGPDGRKEGEYSENSVEHLQTNRAGRQRGVLVKLGESTFRKSEIMSLVYFLACKKCASPRRNI